MAKKKKRPPPQSHDEGVERATKLTEYLYDFEGKPHIMAGVLVDTAFAMIDRIGNATDRRQILDHALEAAYDRLKHSD